MQGGVGILDFGSQYTQLIARRLRELHIYCEIYAYDIAIEELKKHQVKGLIFSGGPSSVYDAHSPKRSTVELMKQWPVLGICYGMQLMAHDLGGEVESHDQKEYGFEEIKWLENSFLSGSQKVWMSHGDSVKKAPPGFQVLAKSSSGHIAAMGKDKFLGLQFHPEVAHTESGLKILEHFAKKICGIDTEWSPPLILQDILTKARKTVGSGEKVLCALSGGVDSTVVAVALTKALGKESVECVFVDNGLLRKNEFEEVGEIYHSLGLNLHSLKAEDRFLSKLKGVIDPEQKRKIIGNTFIEIFEEFEKQQVNGLKWLAQGTLYPDVIESVSPRGTSVTIKTHHNVGGLPKNMKLKLIEPVRELFKDEVRLIGKELGIPDKILNRHPFPGPGLAVRILGDVTKENLKILRACDKIFIDELQKNQLYGQIWQAFCVLLPVRTVGVQGDSRSYGQVVSLRAVTSQDGMTADWFPFEGAFLRKVSNRITNEVKEVNRVVYDITSKPPGTIEWE